MRKQKSNHISLDRNIKNNTILNCLSIFFSFVIIFCIFIYLENAKTFIPLYQQIIGIIIWTIILADLIKNFFIFIINIYSRIGNFFKKIYTFFANFKENILPFITRYYPFSDFWIDSLFHYNNRKELFVLKQITKTTFKIKKPFIVTNVICDSHFIIVIGQFIKTKKRFLKNKVINNIEDSLNLPKESIYIRKEGLDRLRLLIPREYNLS